MNGITMLICWLSIPAVSKDLKLSESTTRSMLNDLRKAGLVPTEQRFRENGGIAVCSILCDKSMKTRHLSATEAYDTVFRIISKAKKLRMFTDKGLRNLGLFTLAEDVVKTTGVEYYVLDELPPEPSYMAVQKIVDQFKESGADLIVASLAASWTPSSWQVCWLPTRTASRSCWTTPDRHTSACPSY